MVNPISSNIHHIDDNNQDDDNDIQVDENSDDNQVDKNSNDGDKSHSFKPLPSHASSRAVEVHQLLESGMSPSKSVTTRDSPQSPDEASNVALSGLNQLQNGVNPPIPPVPTEPPVKSKTRGLRHINNLI